MVRARSEAGRWVAGWQLIESLRSLSTLSLPVQHCETQDKTLDGASVGIIVTREFACFILSSSLSFLACLARSPGEREGEIELIRSDHTYSFVYDDGAWG